MRLQDHMIDVTRAAAKDAFQNARAVSEDKRDWKPLDLGRSVLDQCRELAMCPTWAVDIIDSKEQPEWNEASMAAIQKEQEQWKTVDDCEAECKRRLEVLFSLFKNMPDERLAETKCPMTVVATSRWRR